MKMCASPKLRQQVLHTLVDGVGRDVSLREVRRRKARKGKKQMGYPVAYRRGRSPQRGPVQALGDIPPWLGFGAVAGIVAADWATRNLLNTLGAWQTLQPHQVFRQTPAAYGWTLTLDCGRPPERLPAGAFTDCAAGKLMSNVAWASEAQGVQNPNSTSSATLYYWANGRRFSSILMAADPAQRWDQGAGRDFANLSLIAGSFPLWGPARRALVAGALAEAGFSQTGYAAPGDIPGRLPGFDILDGRWIIVIGGGAGTGGVSRPDTGVIPRPVARTVPATGMREVKFNANTRAGRMFFAMYSVFNLLGDVHGAARALWFSIPDEKRGSSMRLSRMVNDIWRNWRDIDPLLGAANLAKWKFLDTLYGGTQGAMFKAIAAGYGYPLARVWATLESEIHNTVEFQRKKVEREQDSQRGG